MRAPHVLVVDDWIDNADMTALLVELWGYSAEAHYGGWPALTAARARPPAAVLLDLGMGPMDGFEFVQRFRVVSGCEQVPVVAISGHTSETMQARARSAGVVEYLFKPAEPGVLRALLVRLLPMPVRNAGAVSCGRPLLTPTT